MARIYPACIANIQWLRRVGDPYSDGLEQEPDVVAERIPLEDPARASHGALGEERLAAGPYIPCARRELVDVIAGFAAKQLGEIRPLSGYEMHTQMRGIDAAPNVAFFTDRHTSRRGGWILACVANPTRHPSCDAPAAG